MVGGSQGTWRKPILTQGTHTNSTQRGESLTQESNHCTTMQPKMEKSWMDNGIINIINKMSSWAQRPYISLKHYCHHSGRPRWPGLHWSVHQLIWASLHQREALSFSRSIGLPCQSTCSHWTGKKSSCHDSTCGHQSNKLDFGGQTCPCTNSRLWGTVGCTYEC